MSAAQTDKLTRYEIRRVTNTSKGESHHVGYVEARDVDEAARLACAGGMIEDFQSFFTIPVDPCTECDGRGFYSGWPHTTCPACAGTGTQS